MKNLPHSSLNVGEAAGRGLETTVLALAAGLAHAPVPHLSKPFHTIVRKQYRQYHCPWPKPPGLSSCWFQCGLPTGIHSGKDHCWAPAGIPGLTFQAGILFLHQIFGSELLGIARYEVPFAIMYHQHFQEFSNLLLSDMITHHEDHIQETCQTSLG